VPYTQRVGQGPREGGVLVRNPATGEEVILNAGPSCDKLWFSANGEWLVFEGFDRELLWSTRTWRRREFNDRVELEEALDALGVTPHAGVGESVAPEYAVGWKSHFQKLKYSAYGELKAGEGWVVRVWCRSHPLLADDCDLEFVPTDYDRVFELFSEWMATPQADEP
jgi:hypothetical protein